MNQDFSKSVWVLGTKINNVKCFDWVNDKLDNFADCRTLVVDMRSFNDSTAHMMTIPRMREIQEQVKKRFIAGGNIICVLTERKVVTVKERFQIDNEFWSPINFSPRKINTGRDFELVSNFGYDNYLSKIKEWDVQIQQNIPTGIPLLQNEVNEVIIESRLKTGDDGFIGGIYSINTGQRMSGKYVALPKIGREPREAIEEILKSLGIFKETPPPSWTRDITISGTEHLVNKINETKKKIEHLEEEEKILHSELDELNKFKKLLYATDTELECIVIDALKFLGISSARTGRAKKEDVLFDFTLDDVDLAVIEVKGRTKGTDLDDFRQADNWVWDYRKEGKKAKPILIANCFRLQDIISTSVKRIDFESHREFFEQHKIAVVPTLTLFQLIEHKLKGNSIDVDKLEKIMSTSNDVLRLEDLI